jgi:hypothetical protein
MSSNGSEKFTQSPFANGAGSYPPAHAENKPSIKLIIIKSNVLNNYKKTPRYIQIQFLDHKYRFLCSLYLGINPD